MSRVGTVYLVGAGPGDPGLLSLKGLDCLKQADLILYDGLVNPLLLQHSSAAAERTCRSTGPSGRVLDQEEINRKLIGAAAEGKCVVRLKGGDPFIFGRGSEEARALAEAGIPFEVVPGITAATAASEYAGISLTHRKLASAVAFITGHEDPNKGETSIDFDNLARFAGTLVFYMGLHHLESIVESLLKSGKAAATPSCVISRATTPAQRTVSAPLQDLVSAVRDAGLRPPSLIVVGECVEQRESIAWFEKRPLFGKRIGITRPAEQAGPVIAQAWELGAEPLLIPTIQILAPDDWTEVDAVLNRLGEFDWLIFTSANGVHGLLGRLWNQAGDMRRLAGIRLAAIGPGTADALAGYHLRADVVPPAYRAEALAKSLEPYVEGKRLLWARASRGRDVLPTQLKKMGATVEQLVVYRNIDATSLPSAELNLIETGAVDWIGLSSPSIACNLKQLLTTAALEQVGKSVRLASISPVTSQSARQAGLPIAAEATDYTWEGIFDAIVAYEQSTD